MQLSYCPTSFEPFPFIPGPAKGYHCKLYRKEPGALFILPGFVYFLSIFVTFVPCRPIPAISPLWLKKKA